MFHLPQIIQLKHTTATSGTAFSIFTSSRYVFMCILLAHLI